MSRSRILGGIALAFGLLTTGSATRSGAQIPEPVLAMSVRPYHTENSCANAPLPCEGVAWAQATGRYEFDIYRVPVGSFESPSDRVRFCMQWPSAWNLVSTEICEGALESGDLSVSGSLLEFAFAECFAVDAPFLRIVMDCPTAGSMWASCGPAVQLCWYEEWTEESYPLQCDVGDWCGRQPLHPCDFCSTGYHEAAGFDPPSFERTLAPGEVWSGSLFVWGDLGPDCGGPPECGEGHGRCFGGLRADVPWLTTTILWPPSDGFQHVPYILRMDATGLPPGRYEGNLISEPGCGWCVENCMAVTLTVQDPAAVEGGALPESVRLDGPFPNPSMERFGYAITLPAPSHARVDLLDVAGRSVAALLDRDLPAGTHEFSWDGSGSAIPSGTYVLRLEANSVRRSRLIVLAR